VASGILTLDAWLPCRTLLRRLAWTCPTLAALVSSHDLRAAIAAAGFANGAPCQWDRLQPTRQRLGVLTVLWESSSRNWSSIYSNFNVIRQAAVSCSVW
jgi:hypothetical protein